MTQKERVIQMAQAAANRQNKPFAAVNLNQYSPMWVCREWRDDMAGDASCIRVDPKQEN